jgi:hypothetical protein
MHKNALIIQRGRCVAAKVAGRIEFFAEVDPREQLLMRKSLQIGRRVTAAPQLAAPQLAAPQLAAPQLAAPPVEPEPAALGVEPSHALPRRPRYQAPDDSQLHGRRRMGF